MQSIQSGFKLRYSKLFTHHFPPFLVALSKESHFKELIFAPVHVNAGQKH